MKIYLRFLTMEKTRVIFVKSMSDLFRRSARKGYSSNIRNNGKRPRQTYFPDIDKKRAERLYELAPRLYGKKHLDGSNR